MSIAEGSSIMKLTELMEEPHQVDQIYGSSPNYKLHEALWQCQSLFNEVRGRLATKTVVLFTNTDDPHAGDAALKRQAVKKAGDLAETGITLQVLPLDLGRRGQSTFRWATFYRDMIQTPAGSAADEASLEESMKEITIRKKEDLLRVIRKKDHHKRSSGKLKFDFGQGWCDYTTNDSTILRHRRLPSSN